ncbi:hypothetical protein [Hyalangium versicolor]|uniref:hypothetical protein n=1 Tax=Hyalangium versicolor TaxID=2861190 RepID=UPI001CCA6532|nr:hypothetical protein [Hyalangium versicolor]
MRMRQSVAVMALVLGTMSGLGCSSDLNEQVQTYYYKGINTTRSADGQVTAQGETLLRRVFNGPQSLIIEDVLTRDADQNVAETIFNFRVQGSTLTDPNTGFTGQLVGGEAWDWIQWTVTGTLDDGTTIVSTSSINENKVIVDMSFKKGDVLQFSVKHEVLSILGERYDDLREQWAKSP